MTKTSNVSAAQIKSMRASLDRQDIAVNDLLAVETVPARQVQLAQAALDIARQRVDLDRLAAAYAASNLEQSEAEQRLKAGATRIRNHTSGVANLTKVLTGISTVASVFTNLFAIFA